MDENGKADDEVKVELQKLMARRSENVVLAPGRHYEVIDGDEGGKGVNTSQWLPGLVASRA